MHVYTPEQWLLLFYFYCLCGWIWESCFVSCKQRRWVNRGFLHGPWLPIYGSGAIIILFATLPVKGSAIGIALMGTFAATLLEYVTGAVMERIFKMRYWDYSNQPCNLNGYICLTSSIGWAGFSSNSVMVSFSSTLMMPKRGASSQSTSITEMVQSAPVFLWWASILS